MIKAFLVVMYLCGSPTLIIAADADTVVAGTPTFFEFDEVSFEHLTHVITTVKESGNVHYYIVHLDRETGMTCL